MLGVGVVVPTVTMADPGENMENAPPPLQHHLFQSMWTRACFVCAKAGAATSRLEAAIKTATNRAPPMRIP